MSIEFTTVAIGALSSVVSVVSFFLTKYAAKGVEGKKTFVIKNSEGETREITITSGQKSDEVVKLLNDNLAYEKLIESTLRKLGTSDVKVEKNNKHDLGYDFILTILENKYLVEAKANKKPVNKRVLEKLLKAASQQNSKAVVFSKSGFEKAALKWLEAQPDASNLTLKTAKNKDQIKKAMRELVE
ncbi:TPA: restriction endonuclease [Vibrio vulnificus]